MTFKITIEENSVAATKFQEFMAEKKAFREAAEAGKAIEYAIENKKKFATPLPSLTPQQ